MEACCTSPFHLPGLICPLFCPPPSWNVFPVCYKVITVIWGREKRREWIGICYATLILGTFFFIFFTGWTLFEQKCGLHYLGCWHQPYLCSVALDFCSYVGCPLFSQLHMLLFWYLVSATNNQMHWFLWAPLKLWMGNRHKREHPPVYRLPLTIR